MTTNKPTKRTETGHSSHEHEHEHTEPVEEEPAIEPSSHPAEAEIMEGKGLNLTVYVSGIPIGSSLVSTKDDIPAAVMAIMKENGMPDHSAAVRHQDLAGSGNGWTLLAGIDGNGAANMP